MECSWQPILPILTQLRIAGELMPVEPPQNNGNGRYRHKFLLFLL
jgi:hypothetical protein